MEQANVSGMAAYQALCDEAERDFEGFWARLAREHLLWTKPFTKTLDESNAPFFKWFDDGELNASYNCLDRHLKTQPDKVAIIFEADDGKVTKRHLQAALPPRLPVRQRAEGAGMQKGDRVLIYMPMSIEAVVAMQACARIGATHSVVFGGFSAKSLQERIIDAGAVAVITADGQMRGGKEIPLKPAVRRGARAWAAASTCKNVIVYKRTGSHVAMSAPAATSGGTTWCEGQAEDCEPTWVERRASAVHPLHLRLHRQAEGRAALDGAATCCTRCSR